MIDRIVYIKETLILAAPRIYPLGYVRRRGVSRAGKKSEKEVG